MQLLLQMKLVGTLLSSKLKSRASHTSILASRWSSAWLMHARMAVWSASQATSQSLMVVISPVMISQRVSVGTLLWVARVERTVLGDIGVFSLKMMGGDWNLGPEQWESWDGVR